jgi:SAM-dependent methyltransferase
VAPYLGTNDIWMGVSATGMTKTACRAVQALESRGVRRIDSWLPTDGVTAEFGCGYGRWFGVTGTRRRLVGMDFSRSLARVAAAHPANIRVVVGDVRNPPFESNSFAAVYTVKTLQFLNIQDRAVAIRRIFECVVPGGQVILFERVTGPDHETPRDWIRLGEDAGGRLLDWSGNQFTPLDRAAQALITGLLRRRTAQQGDRAKPNLSVRLGPRDILRVVHARLREVLLLASLPAEPLVEHVFPRDWAENGIFRFEKHA